VARKDVGKVNNDFVNSYRLNFHANKHAYIDAFN